MQRAKAVRTLVVDDDAVYRRIITRTLEGIPSIAIIGAVGSLALARTMIEQGGIDAITLDVVLRNESGLDLLRWLRAAHPAIRTVLVTSGSERQARTAIDALLLGAVALVLKPSGANAQHELTSALADALVPVGGAAARAAPSLAAGTTPSARVVAKPRRLIAIGASTGGPPVVMSLLASLPPNWAVPVVVVQHLPAPHVPHFAELLTTRTGRRVVPSTHGMALQPHDVVVATGGVHTIVVARKDQLVLEHLDGPPEHNCLPAVDPLFRSVAAAVGAAAVGVVISGMGSDGALGALALKKAGCPVVAQDEASSVVWGMPGATVAAGAADAIAPAAELASWVTRWTRVP